MSPDQAAQVLAALSAAWPSHDMPEETIHLWVGLLADVDQADAMAAAKRIVREDRFFPPISRYLQACEERAHARRNRTAAERGLAAAPTEPVGPPPRLVKAVRGMLAAQRKNRHWHGGPDPCQICGGMATPADQQTQPHPWGEPTPHPEETR